MELVARGERARRRTGEHSRPSRGIALVAAAALLTTLVVAGFAARLPQVAGPVFARWPFAGVGFRAALVALAPGLALVAGAFVLAVRSPRVDAPRIGIWLLALASLLLQAGSWEARGPAFDVAARRIENPEVASFYADARAGLDRGAWLSRFDRLPLSAESATHPPGPILSYAIRIQPVDACVVGACSADGGPHTWSSVVASGPSRRV